MYIINKRDTIYKVIDERGHWFIRNIKEGFWEEETFNIIDEYQNVEKIYLDIGSWIGPTVLYANNKFKQIFAFEPDPVAAEILKQNISINNYDNIILIQKAISNTNGICEFGGNGELGNSMSTLLVGTPDKEKFFNNYGQPNQFLSPEIRKKDIIKIESITIENFLEQYNIQANNIGLIKIDIEGGELLVIPQMESFLKKYKPNLYISLHYVFLTEQQIEEIVKILFGIYSKCYIYDNIKQEISQSFIVDNKKTQLVFVE